MKRILNQIFVTLGVLFFVLILIGIYFFVTDPLQLKPMFFGKGPAQPSTMNSTHTVGEGIQTDTNAGETQGGFQLSDDQRQALIAFGIDPASVPSSISSDQETCFIGVLGAARVAEIKAGAVPSALEFFKAKACV